MSELQHFLSLMDTIHDYGNTGRTAKAITRKSLGVDENDDEYDDDTFTFNKAYLVDFLMLALIQNDFKDIIGLSKKHNYLVSRANCKSEKVIQQQIQQDICSRFYFPTFEGKVVFRSPKPEAITKDILFASKQYQENIDIVTNIESLTPTQFENIISLPKLQSGDIDEKREHLKSILCKVLNCSTIVYVVDANALDNKIFEKAIYRGLFVKYDAAPANTNVAKNVKPTKTTLTKTPNFDEDENIVLPEFQEYALSKASKELLYLDELMVNKEGSEYIVSFKVHNSPNKSPYKIYTDIETNNKFSKGLGLFVQLINAINENTLGVQKMGKESKDNLKDKLERLGMQCFMDKYSTTLDMFSNNTGDSVLKLGKVDFILALFDFKRAMDYLYVKACHTANTNATDMTKKFVFVSSDRSAIYYAINLGCPCVLTMPSIKYGSRKGEQDIIVYNPYYKQTSLSKSEEDEEPCDFECLLRKIIEKEETYEMQDEIQYLIHQLEVNEELISEKLKKEKRKKNKNENEIKRLEDLQATIGTAFDQLYENKFELENNKKLSNPNSLAENYNIVKQKYSPKPPKSPQVEIKKDENEEDVKKNFNQR